MTTQSREIEAREKDEIVTEDTRPGLVFRPDVDILERTDAYVIHADMPGANDESVQIDLANGVLTLDAQLADDALPEEVRSARPRHSEYQVGGYHREFRISRDIDPSGATARMKHGVLELVLPKTADRQPRRIAVEAA